MTPLRPTNIHALLDHIYLYRKFVLWRHQNEWITTLKKMFIYNIYDDIISDDLKIVKYLLPGKSDEIPVLYEIHGIYFKNCHRANCIGTNDRLR